MVGFLASQVTPPGREAFHPYADIPGIEFGLALLVLAAGIYLSKLLVRLLGRPIARRFERQSMAQTVLRGIRVSTIVAALFAAGWVAGLSFPSLVLSVTVFSAIVGIILAPVIANVINGLFVLADQPFEIGDMIELDDGTRAFIEDITIRYTKVITTDNTFLVIPNENIRERDVENYSAEDERTRLTLPLLVTYESDVATAREVMERAARECDAVVEGGPDIRIGAARYSASPVTFIEEYGDDGVLITLRYWAKKPYKLLKVRSAVHERIWRAFDREDVDVEFAYPHQHLVFDETSGTANVAFQEAPEDLATGRGVTGVSNGGSDRSIDRRGGGKSVSGGQPEPDDGDKS